MTRRSASERERRRRRANVLYEFEMVLREEGVSDFAYDEGEDLVRFPHGRFAFPGEWADVDLLQERGYFGQVYLDSSVLSLTSTEHRCKERRPGHGSKATKATI